MLLIACVWICVVYGVPEFYVCVFCMCVCVVCVCVLCVCVCVCVVCVWCVCGMCGVCVCVCVCVWCVCVCVCVQVGNYLGQYLELLLKAVLSKMQLVQTSTVMQSLLCVFAHLIQREVRICG